MRPRPHVAARTKAGERWRRALPAGLLACGAAFAPAISSAQGASARASFHVDGAALDIRLQPGPASGAMSLVTEVSGRNSVAWTDAAATPPGTIVRSGLWLGDDGCDTCPPGPHEQVVALTAGPGAGPHAEGTTDGLTGRAVAPAGTSPRGIGLSSQGVYTLTLAVTGSGMLHLSVPYRLVLDSGTGGLPAQASFTASLRSSAPLADDRTLRVAQRAPRGSPVGSVVEDVLSFSVRARPDDPVSNRATWTLTLSSTATVGLVPEPGSAMLAGLGLLGLLPILRVARRRPQGSSTLLPVVRRASSSRCAAATSASA